MASINFMKIKNASSVKAMLRHCDSDERLKHEHSNKDIDKERTNENVNYTHLTYEQSCNRYDNRLKQLDSQPKANLRKDRVTCFGLTVPACEGMTHDEAKSFFRDVCKEFQNQFNGKNIVAAVAHFDEIHSYVDHGELKESRAHLHFYVIPEISGKLNGKQFSSKKRMIELNKAIDNIAREKYNKRFLTNEKPRHRTVEELKSLSELELREKEDIIRDVTIVFKENEHLKKALKDIRAYSEKEHYDKLIEYCDRALKYNQERFEKPQIKQKTLVVDEYER